MRDYIEKIMVPTDFSENAKKALYYAADLTIRAKGTLYLYHSYIPLDGPFIENEEIREQYNVAKELIIEKQFLELKEKLNAKFLNLQILTFIGTAPLVNNICEFAESNEMDLIVMGTQGATGIRKVIIGSISAKVGKKIKTPLLLIPPSDSWVAPKHIVYTSNYNLNDFFALNYTLKIAKLYQSQITFLHLIAKELSSDELQNEQDQFESYKAGLKEEIEEPVTYKLLETFSIGKKIENLDEVIGYDLLVMIPRKKSFFDRLLTESFTRNMTFLTQKPLLIIPELNEN